MALPPDDLRVALSSASDGVYLNVVVQPGASRNRVVGLHGDALKLAVTAPPERGRANLEVTRLIASTVGVPRRDVEVRSGMTSRRKRLFIAGITVDTALARLTPRD